MTDNNDLKMKILERIEEFSLEEFFNPKYSNLSNGYGIGAVEVITPFQNVRIINVESNDLESGKSILGLGSHRRTILEIYQVIYDTQPLDPVNIFSWPNYVREGDKHNIQIRYVNESDGDTIEIECPNCINSYQFECLKILNEEITLLSNKKASNINILFSSFNYIETFVNNMDYLINNFPLTIDDSVDYKCFEYPIASVGTKRLN